MDKDTTRIEALSDGIFAVAITLLAFNIGVDLKEIQVLHPLRTTTNTELKELLIGEWPKIFAYCISFLAVLMMWISHHQLFKHIRHANAKLIFANGFLLLVVAMLPFPTKTLGEFINSPAQKTGILLYTGYTLLISLSFLLFVYAARSDRAQLVAGTTESQIAKIIKAMWIGFTLNTLIFVSAFFAPLPALFVSFCMWIYWSSVRRKNG